MGHDFLQITPISTTIFHLTGINTLVLDKDGSTLFAHEHDQLLDFLFEEQKETLQHLCKEAVRLDQCCLYTNDWGLSYLARNFQTSNNGTLILVNGPFLLQIPDTSKLNIQQNSRFALEEFFRGLTLLGISKVQSITNILDKAETLYHVPMKVVPARQKQVEQHQKSITDSNYYQPDEQDVELIEHKYRFEKEIMHAVELGDTELINDLMIKMKNMYDLSDRFPNQPVRAMKNGLIIFNTLLRIAAENGKVQPFFLHKISEKFSKQIERTDKIESHDTLMALMSNEYCELVNHNAISGYSPLIKKAMEHLNTYMGKPLNLDSLSQHCFVHPAHLSRQFKKETGMTLTDYQNLIRINEAKRLLKNAQDTIANIAGAVGFNDSGYFTRIFKKIEGITPTEYRSIQ
ncbi:helix-turn-helix transcriptional regulator [Candidatus Pristimantibacillus sp. PTI5]|uniref:helix-turn-helix transcriptional regulator n=1 Tax=Candidatus Pristimantibacillus sp. PTI5 TaxID=3400422 RepID=UPI003B02CB8A